MQNSKSILLVEDDPFLIDIYVTKLEQDGFNVEVARDGQEALEKLGQKMPVLVVLDIMLPKMNGWEVLKEISQDRKFKKLKVIILSNLGEKEDVAKGFESGAVKYLVKAQYTPTEVIGAIKEILK